MAVITQEQLALRRDELNSMLKMAGIRNFRANELDKHFNHRWDGPDRILPGREKLSNIIPSLLVLQVIRDSLGPIEILSGYRFDEYNDLLPGASPDSQHKNFTAVDFRPVGAFAKISWEEFLAVTLSVVMSAMSAHGMVDSDLKMGVFIYPPSDDRTGFIHLDFGEFREESIIRRIN